jgi:hypothetical protein
VLSGSRYERKAQLEFCKLLVVRCSQLEGTPSSGRYKHAEHVGFLQRVAQRLAGDVRVDFGSREARLDHNATSKLVNSDMP